MRGFRPGLWPTLAALAVVAATVLLGNWQHGRASYKASLQSQAFKAASEPAIELSSASAIAAAMRYRQVVAGGSYAADHQIWLDNRTHKGTSGYYVLTPLQLADGSHVLVNRGWIAAAKYRDIVPAAAPAPGVVRVQGRLNAPPPSFLALSNAPAAGAVWQNLDLAEYSRVHGIAVAPLVIEQTLTPADGLIRDWPLPDFGRDTNISYMWQWYSFAAVAAMFWIVLGFRAACPRSSEKNRGK